MATAPDTHPAFTGPDLCRLTARDAVALLKSGDASPDDFITAAMARIATTSPDINAMVTSCEDRARRSAQTASIDSPLAGLPIGIKDLNPVQGVRTTFGTPGLADFVPEVSDPLVTRLEQRGAVVLGMTNTPEMGAGANTFNAVFGPTRNPWDTRMNAGGSSGGAAAGLAAGEVWLSQGSDLGGSLRTPASYCGIVGLRPSPGIAGGASALRGFDNMPVNGPMARNVADCALFLDAMVGFDPQSPISHPADPNGYLNTCLQDAGPIRIAFSADMNGLAPVTTEMDGLLRDAINRLATDGVSVTEAQPKLRDVDQSFRALRGLAMWAQYRNTPKRISDHYKATLKQNIQDGRSLTVDDIADAEVARSLIYDTLRGFLADFDVLACPVSGLLPLPVEHEYPPEVAGVASRDYLDWLRFAFPATLAGLPALSLPIGFSGSGMPVGMQLIGKPRGEARLLQVARTLEERLALPMTPIDPQRRH